MADADLFASETRTAGDLAGVFEYDGDTGYFYLYSSVEPSQRVIGSVHVYSGNLDLRERDVEVRWDDEERVVGLMIHGELWAAFDTLDNSKWGGDYRPGASPRVPDELAMRFRHATAS